MKVPLALKDLKVRLAQLVPKVFKVMLDPKVLKAPLALTHFRPLTQILLPPL